MMMNFEKLLVATPVEPLFEAKFWQSNLLILDMNDSSWDKIDIFDVNELIRNTQKLLNQTNSIMAIGQYGEDREKLYSRSELFQKPIRSIHLGLDFTVPVGTTIYLPLDGIVFDFNNNNQDGDYGPTIIIQHEINNAKFYSLYGHLSISSLDKIKINQKIKAGGLLGTVGGKSENGHWPPHLHFQIIKDLKNNTGGYPGVCTREDFIIEQINCPNPNLLLKHPALIGLHDKTNVPSGPMLRE